MPDLAALPKTYALIGGLIAFLEKSYILADMRRQKVAQIRPRYFGEGRRGPRIVDKNKSLVANHMLRILYSVSMGTVPYLETRVTSSTWSFGFNVLDILAGL